MTRHFSGSLAKLSNGVYAITDEHLLAGRLLTSVERTLQAGTRLVQYRNKHDNVATQLEQASALKTLCDRYDALLLINDNAQLCQAVNADGIHIGQGDMKLVEARRQLGPDAIIGVSCHSSPALAAQAEADGASYLAMGRFFPSQTKPDAPQADISGLQAVRRQTRLPIVAIGGVTSTNGASLLAAGADMLAVINYLFATDEVDEVATRTRQLVALFDAD